MNLGFNSNVNAGGTVYHVQTEDRGPGHPFVDTVVLWQGQVLYRTSKSYEDLLAGGISGETKLRDRVEQQHAEIVSALRSGSLSLQEKSAGAIQLQLCNPQSWLSAGQVSLDVQVSARANGRAVSDVEVEAFVEGAVDPAAKFSARTDAEGKASVSFPLPAIGDASAALVIEARTGSSRDQLRYNLKSKPQAPVPAQG